MSNSLLKEILKPAVFLAGFALLGTAALATVYDLTKPTVEENERLATLEKLNELVSPQQYDNALIDSKLELPADAFGSSEKVTAYRATRRGVPVAALFTVAAPDGYSGSIRMVIGIYADQTLAGVRILKHKETPGLGDKIDKNKSNWVDQFMGKSLLNHPPTAWAVKKDGGVFDQFTGATITPRSVVGAVKRTILWSQQNFTALFSQPVTPVQQEAGQ